MYMGRQVCRMLRAGDVRRAKQTDAATKPRFGGEGCPASQPDRNRERCMKAESRKQGWRSAKKGVSEKFLRELPTSLSTAIQRGYPQVLTLKRIYDRCDEVGDCRIWRQSVQSAGYPQISGAGCRPRAVSHLVLALTGRERPTPRHCASPNCGEKRCVSEHCLRWLLPHQIMARSYASGARACAAEYFGRVARARSSGFTQLDWPTVERMRDAMLAGATAADVAREQGLSVSSVRAIRRGDTWRRSGPMPASGGQG